MEGTVKTRPNHYQALGVSPTATGDEIARAFARQGGVYRPHVFGSLAELCIAFETLRDPVKRRAYDASIGLNRELKASSFTSGARWAAVAPGAVKPAPVVSQPIPAAQAPVPESAPQQEATQKVRPALPLGPGPDLKARHEPRFVRGDAPRMALERQLGVEARPVDWQRAGMALGSIVIAACVLGGLAGWWSAGAIETTATSEGAVSVPLPAAKPIAIASTPSTEPAPVPSAPKTFIERRNPVAIAATTTEFASVAEELDSPQDQAAQILPEPAPVEQGDSGAPAMATVSNPMPLPNRVIARTIQRIGYSCGSVASTERVEGDGSGVYKVTCSSGQSYQARPVNGRYRFRRWGRS